MTRKIFAALRGLYQQNPIVYSLIELFLFLGLYFFNIWVTSFWFWGIYRLRIPVPDIIERIFFYVWHMNPYCMALSATLGLSLLLVTLSVRKDPLRELGIRLDNLKASGRECLVMFLIGSSLILFVFLFHREDFIYHPLRHYLHWLFLKYPLWGIVQQFWLQSVIFVRLLQILKDKNRTIFAAAVIFALLHAPGISFVVITFIAGLGCCILFSRHRNIFTLGILHAVMAVMVHSLLVPGVINSFVPGPIRGPWKNNTEFVAYLTYEGNTIVARPSAIIKIPIEVENKGTALWDSNEKQHPVHISYHILDVDGNMIAFDNIRTPLPHSLGPGETLKVDVTVIVPPDLGHYQLEIDIVKEFVAWFKDKGSLTIHIPLVVSERENVLLTRFCKKNGGII